MQRPHHPTYLNLNEREIDRHVYRIISTERFYDLFEAGENVLVRPAKWEDPFENFVLNSPARLTNGTIVRFGFNNDFYGQCWTLAQSSDAMWRIYSPDSMSVRIRTTIRRLAESLSEGLGNWARVQAFIGKVRYLGDRQLIDFANGIFANGLAEPALAHTLLVKRRAFVHEKEVRLLYFEKQNERQDNLYRYKIDPHVLIDQVMIDPRLDQNKVNDLKKEIRTRTNFTGAIKRSLLYAPPKGMVFPIGA